MSEDEIYRQIGQILIDTAPDAASAVIVEAELSPEDDHCKLLFILMAMERKIGSAQAAQRSMLVFMKT
jgi:hypothetical protein